MQDSNSPKIVILKDLMDSPLVRLMRLCDQWNDFEYRIFNTKTKRDMDVCLDNIRHIINTYPDLKQYVSIKSYQFYIPIL